MIQLSLDVIVLIVLFVIFTVLVIAIVVALVYFHRRRKSISELAEVEHRPPRNVYSSHVAHPISPRISAVPRILPDHTEWMTIEEVRTVRQIVNPGPARKPLTEDLYYNTSNQVGAGGPQDSVPPSRPPPPKNKPNLATSTKPSISANADAQGSVVERRASPKTSIAQNSQLDTNSPPGANDSAGNITCEETESSNLPETSEKREDNVQNIPQRDMGQTQPFPVSSTVTNGKTPISPNLPETPLTDEEVQNTLQKKSSKKRPLPTPPPLANGNCPTSSFKETAVVNLNTSGTSLSDDKVQNFQRKNSCKNLPLPSTPHANGKNYSPRRPVPLDSPIATPMHSNASERSRSNDKVHNILQKNSSKNRPLPPPPSLANGVSNTPISKEKTSVHLTRPVGKVLQKHNSQNRPLPTPPPVPKGVSYKTSVQERNLTIENKSKNRPLPAPPPVANGVSRTTISEEKTPETPSTSQTSQVDNNLRHTPVETNGPVGARIIPPKPPVLPKSSPTKGGHVLQSKKSPISKTKETTPEKSMNENRAEQSPEYINSPKVPSSPPVAAKRRLIPKEGATGKMNTPYTVKSQNATDAQEPPEYINNLTSKKNHGSHGSLATSDYLNTHKTIEKTGDLEPPEYINTTRTFEKAGAPEPPQYINTKEVPQHVNNTHEHPEYINCTANNSSQPSAMKVQKQGNVPATTPKGSSEHTDVLNTPSYESPSIVQSLNFASITATQINFINGFIDLTEEPPSYANTPGDPQSRWEHQEDTDEVDGSSAHPKNPDSDDSSDDSDILETVPNVHMLRYLRHLHQEEEELVPHQGSGSEGPSPGKHVTLL